MSLILDALNRADRERKNTRITPDINTIHEVTYRPTTTSRSKKILLVTVVVLLVAVLLLAYSVLQNRSHSSAADINLQAQNPVQSNPPLPERAPANNQASIARPTSIAGTAPVGEAGNDKRVNTNNTPARESPAPAAEVNLLYAETNKIRKPTNAAAKTGDAQKVRVENQVSDLYKPVEEPAVVESVALAPQTITPVSLVEEERSNKTYALLTEVPDLSELPPMLQREIPSLRYSQHNFAADGVSNVVINGQPRSARSMLAPEVSLDEIYVDGILLRFREHKFKLRALNNWVNM